MIPPRVMIAVLSAVVIVIAWLSLAGLGSARDAAPAVDTQIAALPAAEIGVWRTKTQSVFDPVARTLERRMYTVWDPSPSRDLDFAWLPDFPRDDRAGKVNGIGHLIWRYKGKPAYDPASTFADYRGAMKDGRPEGRGSYTDATGLSYDGEWKGGLMDGSGRLTLPGGGEYVGQMRAGKADGSGRYIETTGEIFDGQFVDGLRDGVGTTTLPNASSYRSTWVRGSESEDSRRLRVAQSTGQLAQAAGDDVRIGITIDKTKARKGDLVYAASSEGSRLIIQPDNMRLMRMWKGDDEIQLRDEEEQHGGDTGDEFGVFSFTRGQLLPLTLVIEAQNRSSTPIYIVGSYLKMKSSVTDLQPAIQVLRNFDECASDYRPILRIENFGWSAANHAMLRFAFVDLNANAPTNKREASKSLGDLEKAVAIDLGNELRVAGVNTKALAARSQKGFVCASKSAPACLREIRSSGLFGSIASQIELANSFIFIGVAGTLDYTWRDSSGIEHQRSSPLKVKLPLGHTNMGLECGGGSERDVIAAQPLALKLEQTDYRLPVSFQRSIPAQQTSRFTVTLEATKSSQHDFTIVLQLADGREISSRPISLHYYLPSMFREN